MKNNQQKKKKKKDSKNNKSRSNQPDSSLSSQTLLSFWSCSCLLVTKRNHRNKTWNQLCQFWSFFKIQIMISKRSLRISFFFFLFCLSFISCSFIYGPRKVCVVQCWPRVGTLEWEGLGINPEATLTTLCPWASSITSLCLSIVEKWGFHLMLWFWESNNIM